MKRKRIEVKYPKPTNKFYKKLVDSWFDGNKSKLVNLIQDADNSQLVNYYDLEDETEDLNINELKNLRNENLVEFIIKYAPDNELKIILLEHLMELGILVIHEAVKLDEKFGTNYSTRIISDLLHCGHENMYKTDTPGNSILHIVKDAQLINKLTKVLNININTTNSHKQTPLHTIILKNSFDGYYLVKELINNGADVMAQDAFGNTPLHYSNSCDISMLLLYEGANINAKNIQNITALDMILISCQNFTGSLLEQKFGLIKSLLGCGANHSCSNVEIFRNIEPKIIDELNSAEQAEHLIKYLIEAFSLPIPYSIYNNFNVDRVLNAITSSGFDLTAIINKVDLLYIQSDDLAALYNGISEAIDDSSSDFNFSSSSTPSDEENYNINILGNFDKFYNN